MSGDAVQWEFEAARMAVGLLTSGALRTRRYGPGFALVPRHLFGVTPGDEQKPVPPAMRRDEIAEAGEAYRDMALEARLPDLPAGRGDERHRVPAPSTLACLIEALEPEAGSRVSEVGGGTGWSAAVLATITERRVRTVEIDPRVAEAAVWCLRTAGFAEKVTAASGDGYFGHPASAAYDRVLVSAAVTGLSPSWLGQLAPGGRIVVPLALGGRALIVTVRRGEDSEIRGRAHAVLDLPAAAGPLAPGQAPRVPTGADLPWSEGEPLPEKLDPDKPSQGYLDAWVYLALKHPGHVTMTTSEAMGSGPLAALVDPGDGSAVVLTAGRMRQRGPSGPALAARAAAAVAAWQQAGQPGLEHLRCGWRFAGTDAAPILTPHRWRFEP